MENYYDVIDKIDVAKLLDDLKAGNTKYKNNIIPPKDKKYMIDVDGTTVKINIKIGSGFKKSRIVKHPLNYADYNEIISGSEYSQAEKRESDFVLRRLGLLIGISYLLFDEETLKEIYTLAPKKKDGKLYKNRITRIASDAVIELAGIDPDMDKTVSQIFAKSDGDDALSICFDHRYLNAEELEKIREDYISFSWETLGLDKYLLME